MEGICWFVAGKTEEFPAGKARGKPHRREGTSHIHFRRKTDLDEAGIGLVNHILDHPLSTTESDFDRRGDGGVSGIDEPVARTSHAVIFAPPGPHVRPPDDGWARHRVSIGPARFVESFAMAFVRERSTSSNIGHGRKTDTRAPQIGKRQLYRHPEACIG